MSNHQKRISAPNQYPVTREDGTYVVHGAGPHPDQNGLPLVLVLRDALGYAEDTSEAKALVQRGNVLVNGRRQSNIRRTVGLMDIISFPDIDEQYRVLVSGDGLTVTPVDDGDRKLARVDGKTTLPGGVTQLNLSDGNNIETDDDHDTNSSLVVSVPGLDIKEGIPIAEGNTALITGGQHAGTVATVTGIEEVRGSRPNRITLEDGDGNSIETVEHYVYMVGEDEPAVDIDE